MLTISADTKSLVRYFSTWSRDQIPYANSLAVNKVAKRVIAAEAEAIEDTFKSPRAFTKQAFTQSGGFGGMYATKRLPVAMIVAKPTQAAYLAPSEDPKPAQSLWSGAQHVRTPVGIKTNASGDIPRGTLAQAFASPDTFFAEVGGVLGIWQRSTLPRPRGSPKRPRGSIKANTSGRLKLLVAFTRPKNVRTDLHYAARAQAIVDAHWAEDFDASMDQAMATAR